MFEALGAAVIGADQLGRQLMQPGEPVYTAIVQAFGSGVVQRDGTLNKLILVTVPDEIKVARFVARMLGNDAGQEGRREALIRDARARIAAQIPDSEKAARCDYVIDNTRSLKETRGVVEQIYRELVLAAWAESEMI
jgi:dephospho-CoA kinase